MKDSPGEVTLLLNELKLGNKDALGRLIPLVYAELRRLAAHYLQAERIGHTLQPTALVHEAYLRLVEQDRADWQDRAHFLAVAAQLMRRILVDYARARRTAKRGGMAVRIEIAGLQPGRRRNRDRGDSGGGRSSRPARRTGPPADPDRRAALFRRA